MDGNGKIDFVVYLDRRIPAPGVTPLKINQDIFLSEGESGYVLASRAIDEAFDEDRDYLYPVPSNERTLTQGMITQNPGWNDGLDF
ncbi:RagB/SusD family nutrient uptake outer membrane protein [Bacteroides salyersiae]|nr:RagB/SusD family nutrient uptake outer membrane protein [Bacteroides salyersiae]